MFAARRRKHNNEQGSSSSAHVPGSTAAAARSSQQFMQRQLGNTAMQSLADKEAGQREESRLPRIRLKSFSAPQAPAKQSGGQATPDKGISESAGDQDHSVSVTSFSTEAHGVGIRAEIDNPVSHPDYPDGYRWTQTISTNVPLGGTTSPYVDPRPNDDTKPFYWTDAEVMRYPSTFIDHPSRRAPASGTTTWQAVLSLNGVNNRTVSRFDSLSYGFSIDSSGTVTPLYPTCPNGESIQNHQITLASEFSGWTFQG